jgi:hypothetical protein
MVTNGRRPTRGMCTLPIPFSDGVPPPPTLSREREKRERCAKNQCWACIEAV